MYHYTVIMLHTSLKFLYFGFTSVININIYLFFFPYLHTSILMSSKFFMKSMKPLWFYHKGFMLPSLQSHILRVTFSLPALADYFFLRLHFLNLTLMSWFALSVTLIPLPTTFLCLNSLPPPPLAPYSLLCLKRDSGYRWLGPLGHVYLLCLDIGARQKNPSILFPPRLLGRWRETQKNPSPLPNVRWLW